MRHCIARLEERGKLIVVSTPVDPKFELAAVTQRLQQKSGSGTTCRPGTDNLTCPSAENHSQQSLMMRSGTPRKLNR